uniref:Uncharacterized protein n=1 Tax=Lepeophtheirus salmonis TaxID=72036 RepID=A0A0K2T425_LEPSM
MNYINITYTHLNLFMYISFCTKKIITNPRSKSCYKMSKIQSKIYCSLAVLESATYDLTGDGEEGNFQIDEDIHLFFRNENHHTVILTLKNELGSLKKKYEVHIFDLVCKNVPNWILRLFLVLNIILRISVTGIFELIRNIEQ